VFHKPALCQGTASAAPKKPERQGALTPEGLRRAAMAILKHAQEKVSAVFKSWVILPRFPVDCNSKFEACWMQ
jgi:hypothetical protein